MAQVTYNSIRKFRHYGQEFQDEGERSKVDTLRDSLLRQIFQKQSNTHFKIDDCFKNRKKFTSGTRQEDFTQSARGLLTNKTFRKVCNDFNVKETLASCDLDEDEIKILLENNLEKGSESNEAYFQKLQNVALKLEQRQHRLADDSEEHFSSAIYLNRHEFEEECQQRASDDAEKLTSCLVQLKPHSDPTIHPDHPINSLSELEKELFPQNVSDGVSKKDDRLPSKRKLTDETEITDRVRYFKVKPSTLWDMKERPILLSSPSPKWIEVHGCVCEAEHSPIKRVEVIPKSPQSSSQVDYSKPFVWSIDPSSLIPIATINESKITAEEIRKESKFCHYTPGIPSSTLYLKNLPRGIAASSIVSLFGHFDHENGVKIEYRILKGKMKGQAFVKFSNVETAGKALLLCNGYILDGKPLVIEYGKQVV